MTKHDNVSLEGIMKATEFVKEHGIEKARECIEDANDYGGFWVNAKTLELSNLIPSDAVSIPSIQRLVESHELVEFFGSLDDAIQIYEYSKDMEILSYGGREIPTKQLGQAIADVEACQ